MLKGALFRFECVSSPVYPRSFPSGHAKLSNFFYQQAVDWSSSILEDHVRVNSSLEIRAFLALKSLFWKLPFVLLVGKM